MGKVTLKKIHTYDMVLSPSTPTAILTVPEEGNRGVIITNRTKEQTIEDLKQFWGLKTVFPVNISLSCGCSAKYEAPIEFPAGTVKCIHGNSIVEYR